jgi:hypothetical protein
LVDDDRVHTVTWLSPSTAEVAADADTTAWVAAAADEDPDDEQAVSVRATAETISVTPQYEHLGQVHAGV